MKSYKIAFLNSKGGVGKSTLCILSALGLSQTKFTGKIKLIDTDSQKSSVSLLNEITSKIELNYIPFNHTSPNLGVSLLDQKLKAFTKDEEIILVDTMAHPPRQLVNCIMQCNAILIPCNLSEIEIRATIDFIKTLDSLKNLQGGVGSPHLVIIPNKVPHNQVHLDQLTNELSEIDVIIGPTISDLAVLKNDLTNLPSKLSKLPVKFKNQYKGFRDFIYKALVKREIDKLINNTDVEENITENVIPISKKL
jgi:chromosome partitioning protein